MKHPFLNQAVYHPNTMTACFENFKCFYETSRVWNHQQFATPFLSPDRPVYTLTSNMDKPRNSKQLQSFDCLGGVA